uniref:Oxidoreductase, NAD-binding/iron-sulfur cluster-binding protein n=1 Tax=Nitratireductor pacificus pht-3B TaxID=391937 RepID=UPI00051AABD0|nr:Chain A, Oxidoreductase, NAD-binding/iron-sulfur cluster-binding protein [Nitratireductor pacificus pht-3B]4RAS_B Chain B, Oxidoreductase, NAD-binding/iron-sulfur cluster-binding protein [Nitratireductor pacificus pht-3B]4RAS_C Chain C, Oxidoreductase, NAD-binding/iron-sulfur cluster-binding protein [Nitratireductor pacificus pht-3B]
MRLYSNRDRPNHLGPLALERLARVDDVVAQPARQPEDGFAASEDSLLGDVEEYARLFTRFLDGPVAPLGDAIPDDPARRAENLKASAYFLDASMVGICRLDPDDRAGDCDPSHTHALVFAVQFGREPEAGEAGAEWIRGTNAARTDMRCAEIAAILSGYVRWMGFPARGHFSGDAQVDLARLAVRAGLARVVDGVLVAPFLRRGFRLGVVTTGYALAADRPLAPEGDLGETAPEVMLGIDGTRPGWEDAEEEKRPLHMGRYPMETIRRVDEPTTLVVRQEIQRVAKRGDFFKRAEAGDLGEKAKQEKKRFPMKHPLALGMQPLIQNMVPLQGTREKLAPTGKGGDLSDPGRNAEAIKALGYYLGADFVGICRAEPWMYYASDEVEGKPIEAYHDYAVVMLIDQGYETMEGASGDDWISASQSMRAYMRGAEIAGVMAAHCRRMGYSARSHSNAHSEVIHNPAILMAGLGEVSRIGDTLLNPFIGPRSKSIVFTTDLPMSVDRPIDFGLQDFCNQCRKCARECPCNAISFGDKVMFNGYEIWKADVEKCTKYRVTQMKGSACGRCMKMCPWNREDTVEGRRLAELSIKVPEARAAIIAMDDALQNGKRNLIKRWWFDLEVIDGVAGAPRMGTNERDLSPDRGDKIGANQKLAMYPPRLQPPPGTTLDAVLPVDRSGGLAEYAAAETPAAARARLKSSAGHHHHHH